MSRHQVDVADDSLGALEDALAALRAAGMPVDAKVRVKVRASTSFNADGGYARMLTARWDADQAVTGS